MPIHITQVDVPSDLIDMSLGHPSLSLLPLDVMREAADLMAGTQLSHGPIPETCVVEQAGRSAK